MQSKPIVLFVDDEPSVLEGFKLTQGRSYDVLLADSGERGLELLGNIPDVAVVVSDMQMPGLDGAEFLARVKDERPEIVRLLLTGHSDIDAASRAVNEGRIFRFLTKPCEPQKMTNSLQAAIEMHRLITSERVLLQRTLLGAVKAITNVLGLTSPRAMGRAVRIRDRSRQVAEKMQLENRWTVEFSAIFSQLAAASLTEEIETKLYRGEPLADHEKAKVETGIEAVADALRQVPRLEPVSDTLDELVGLARRHAPREENVTMAKTDARLLQAIIDFETHESQGRSPRQALDELRKNEDVYGRDTLAALGEVIQECATLDDGLCPIGALTDGMVIAEDLRTTDGVLLLPRGFELTRSSRMHIVNRFKDRLPENVKVHVYPRRA